MKLIKSLVVATAISTLTVTLSSANDDLVKEGEKIFNTKNLGNCLACHDVNGKKIDGPGSMGPKLQALKYWPDEALYNKIYDPYTDNPISQMPAFGRNGWLSDSEIKAVVAYLKTVE
ncbi:sulfur oxidation c-type cytochrome SoxX [Halarcobacter ebronensis]|uniref:Sulfur oxidation c-type cytochrome SoxX n=1 Tax=Halarcobacter ebronensis TaxID=1462615 RepID=A0A4Q1ALE2_9BACT|nr:sulfur oxidation c-type cytochrome SoxX [Halarcobacter ebronensis]QKF82116.1 sulfur oxidation protein SoxXA, monoheme cytochrome c subunit [Halarcobacter ebronensis]RXK04055.1 sulfur oxidation c-type cytochrome SoxX [Halarcobacter ebronensis]